MVGRNYHRKSLEIILLNEVKVKITGPRRAFGYPIMEGLVHTAEEDTQRQQYPGERERERKACTSVLDDRASQGHHSHQPKENQCSSSVVKHIKAPVDIVWSLVRRFDKPQKYKPFVSRCTLRGGMKIGSVREVNVKSGLPATTSTEMLELLDDQEHILGIKFVGGDHRLKNYSSVTSVHPETVEGRPITLVIESFVVDVPEGNDEDETCYFVNALINCNLKSLAAISEKKATQGRFAAVNRL